MAGTPLTDAINALTTYSNTVTGASDTTLSEAVATLASGYGGGGWTADGIATGNEPYGAIVIDSASGLVENAFNANGYMNNGTGITSLTLTNATEVPTGFCSNCRKLITANLPKVTKINGSAFNYCTTMTSISAPKVEELAGTYVISNCGQLTNLTFPSLTAMNSGDALRNNGKVAVMDLNVIPSINPRAFSNDASLETLILRNTSVVSLGNITAFDGTPAKVGGTGMNVYVPSALISTYQTASNWSTIYARNTMTFVAIEGSYYETHYGDGTPIT